MKITKEELEANTLDGKDGKDGIVAIAKNLGIDTNGLNREPMIEAILKAQEAPKPEGKVEAPKSDGKVEASVAEIAKDVKTIAESSTEKSDTPKSAVAEAKTEDVAAAVNTKPKTSRKLRDKFARKAKSVIKKAEKKPEAVDEAESRTIDTKKTDLSSGLPLEDEVVLPMEADEEQQTAAKYSEEDAKIKKYMDKGFAPETVDNFASVDRIAPIEVARRKAMFYDETKANRE